MEDAPIEWCVFSMREMKFVIKDDLVADGAMHKQWRGTRRGPKKNSPGGKCESIGHVHISNVVDRLTPEEKQAM